MYVESRGDAMLTLETIREKLEPLAIKYDVKHIDLFGSYANGNATEESDVDLLVEFFEPKLKSIAHTMGLLEESMEKLGKSVDIVTLPIARPDRLYIPKTEEIYNVRPGHDRTQVAGRRSSIYNGGYE
jgi:predicted nucleotidyltransferase